MVPLAREFSVSILKPDGSYLWLIPLPDPMLRLRSIPFVEIFSLNFYEIGP